MHTALPTCKFDTWTITSLRDSLVTELLADKTSATLQMFFYAITESGWNEIKKPVLKWMQAKKGRTVTIYAGTDHAITDPNALELMHNSALEVRLMNTYRGVFHPKVVWLKGKTKNLVWVGSNNLTKDGLLNNIEFAVLVSSKDVPSEMVQWTSAVASGSTPINAELIRSYRKERNKFEENRADTKANTFTWSQKKEPETQAKISVRKGDLILEIMQKETRGGNQIQIPKEATKEFFGLSTVGAQKTFNLLRKGDKQTRQLVMTVFKNNTVRLSINELEYRDRPCVITFHKQNKNLIVFDIVPENIFPSRYRALIAMCSQQTREGSRKWIIK